MAVCDELEVIPLSDLVLPAEGVKLGVTREEQLTELAERIAKGLAGGMNAGEVTQMLVEFCRGKKWKFHRGELQQMVVRAQSMLWRVQNQEFDRKQAEQAAARVAPPDELQLVSLAEVTPAPLRWLVPGKIPLGKVTVVCGQAGMGKTSWALDLAARVSQKTGEGPTGPGGRVVILNREDQLHEMIAPRLTASGANLKNIVAIADIKVGMSPSAMAAAEAAGEPVERERSFDLGRDLPVLRKRIETLGDVKLLVIDPLEAYCGTRGLGKWKMRAMVAELERLAAGCGVAVVVISAANQCDLPVKSVWRIDCDLVDSGLRSWVPVRFNLGPLPDGVWFRITDEGVAWDLLRRPLPRAQLGRGSSSKESRTYQIEDAGRWLQEFLDRGARPAKDVLEAGKMRGYSESLIKRAKQILGIGSSKQLSSNGPWLWELCRLPPKPGMNSFGQPLNENEKQALERLDRAVQRARERVPGAMNVV